MISKKFITYSAFTLLELLVVIAILAILASLSLPQFARFRERAMEKEAWTNLKLIQAAAWLYRVEYDTYANLDSTAIVNRDLKLDLPTSASKLEYKLTAATRESFIAFARPKVGGSGWKIDQDDENPSKE